MLFYAPIEKKTTRLSYYVDVSFNSSKAEDDSKCGSYL